MDEHMLNDLLECSVCLDRLDFSSKVLPCQHTFCRKCLVDILASQNKLRCPECRILVDQSIDTLPPNVLLMRILEGMKQNACKNDNNREEHQQIQQPSKAKETATPLAPTYQPSQQQPSQARQKPRRFLLPHAYALFDYTSGEAKDLKFKKGDLILLRHRIDNNWFMGQANGQEGSFPINYVKVVVPLPMPQCIAMYDFKMGPNDEEGCLEFKKSTVIHVLRRVDHNWAEGRIGQTIGIFPIAFVELNAVAKKLLESTQQPQPQSCHQQLTHRALPPVPLIDPTVESNSSSSNTNSPNATTGSSSSSSSSNSTNCSPNHQPLPNSCGSVRYRDKGAKEKRHSLNALLNGGLGQAAPLSLLQTNRHSAEILSLPHELNRLDLTSTSSSSSSSMTTITPTLANQLPTSRILKTHVQQQMPPTLPWGYLALFPYKPRQSDELELKKGCVYIVTERCVDGWFKGKNWLDITGVFPGNYLTPLRARDQQQLMHQWKYVPPAIDVKNSAQSETQQQSLDVRLSNALPTQPPDLPPRQQQPQQTSANVSTSCSVWAKPVEALFSRKSTGGGTEAKVETSASCSSGAVGLMRRLTHIKARSKSPGAPLQQPPKEVTPLESTHEGLTKKATKIQPVHVRSGSCPSQLQLNEATAATTIAPLAGTANSPGQFQPQHMPANATVSYGSQRVKNSKERPHLVCSRQSLDAATFRNMYPAASPPPPATATLYVQPQVQATQLHTNMIISPSHRKSHSLDAGHVLSTSNGAGNAITEAAIKASATTKSTHCTRESRFRCIVPYPPNSDIELELHVGDIIYVQRKQKNGWYKGTHSRTHKTGLFPASFVEPDI
ncbi:E3 ubiquitin-protein ligase SH3RF3 [Scaptodrosophila lebanonensis]|uniref:RING-type E3 ubiquitin transferase n=1 Tax=Drosophila lebanonensis TaxID=7225 RepID=A0A6J2TEB4_DROLE|nr:E3 ubiquitin-protein ligase SH3RF3 [Scaptodrosophila lebanonensis]